MPYKVVKRFEKKQPWNSRFQLGLRLLPLGMAEPSASTKHLLMPRPLGAGRCFANRSEHEISLLHAFMPQAGLSVLPMHRRLNLVQQGPHLCEQVR